MTRLTRSTWWVLPAAIALAAVVIRLVVIAADSGYEPINDAFDYHRHAVSIAAGDGYPDSEYGSGVGPTALRAPAYPVALAGVYVVTGDSVEAGRMLGAALGGVTVLLVFFLAAPVWGRAVGLIAAALTAGFPPLVLLSTELFNENLFIPLALGATLSVTRFGVDGRLRWIGLAGILLGLALLTRNAALALLIPMLVALWLGGRRHGRPLLAPLVAVGVAVLVITPWTLRNAAEFGRFVPIAASSGVTLGGTYNEVSEADEEFPGSWRNPSIVPEFGPLFAIPGIDEASLDAELRDRATDFALDHPGYVLEVSFHNLLRMFMVEGGSVVAFGEAVSEDGIGNTSTTAEQIAMAAIAPLAALGIAAIVVPALRRRRPGMEPARPELLLWLLPLAFLLVSPPLGGLPRYRLPIDPFLLMYAAVGIVYLRGVAAVVIRRRRAAASALAALAALAIAGCSDDGSPGASDPQPDPAVDGSVETIPPRQFERRANAICREAARETERFAATLPERDVPEGLSGPATFAKLVIEPGLEIRARQAQRMRRLPPPEGNVEAYATYVGLFDVTDELLRQRLEIGLDDSIEDAEEIENLIIEVGEEQRAAAAELGADDCAVDLTEIIVPRPAP